MGWIAIGCLLAAAACKGPETPPPPVSPLPAAIPEPARPAPPAADVRTAAEHLAAGIRWLEKGEGEQGRDELLAVLRQEPQNENAKNLLGQIDADPEQMLGKQCFPYTVQYGDSLSKIAKKYLDDPYKFYVLARYNRISDPSDLKVGQTIRVPGKRPASRPGEEPQQAFPAKPAAPALLKPSDGELAAERLYQSGVQALTAGHPERAYDLWSQAVRINPRHPDAPAKLNEVRPAAAQYYYRQAVAASRRQELAETVVNCNKVLEVDPEHEKAKLLRMQALELQERLKQLR